MFVFQVPRNKSKKGGMKKRVYFWGGICWHRKTPGVAWCASDLKVTFRHTKNICHGTVFEEEDDAGNPCVYRVVETRASAATIAVSQKQKQKQKAKPIKQNKKKQNQNIKYTGGVRNNRGKS